MFCLFVVVFFLPETRFAILFCTGDCLNEMSSSVLGKIKKQYH